MAGRTSAQVKDSMRRVDVLDVAVLKVVGRVGRVEAFYGRGALASLELDGVPLVVAQAVAQSKGLLGQAHEQRQLQDPFFYEEKTLLIRQEEGLELRTLDY